MFPPAMSMLVDGSVANSSIMRFKWKLQCGAFRQEDMAPDRKLHQKGNDGLPTIYFEVLCLFQAGYRRLKNNTFQVIRSLKDVACFQVPC